MHANILIATDGSELAGRGLAHGLTLAAALKCPVTLVTVTERFPISADLRDMGVVVTADTLGTYESGQKAVADEILAKAKAEADKLGVVADCVHAPDQHPAEAILSVCKDKGCTMIVMASHGRRGLGRLLVGSQTSEVMAHATVPVLVVR